MISPDPLRAGPPPELVVIGGSAGALEALEALLRQLPAGLSLPVVVLLHLPRGHRSSLAEVLSRLSGWPASEPDDKEPLAPGRLYVAPADYHLLLEPGPAFALSVDAPVLYSRPSIDVLFESAAEVLGRQLMAVLLSGANSDGAAGLRRVHDEGGLAVVQSPDEATSPEMPLAGLAACPHAVVRPAAGIRELLVDLAARRGDGPGSGDNRVKTHA